MKNDYTHLAILLDRSGSMQPKWADTLGALESLFKEQKSVPGHMTVSMATFSSEYHLSHDFVDVKNVETLTNLPSPAGWTALYDAFCKLVDSVGSKLAEMQEYERPSKVLFVVITDGYENHSRKFSFSDVKSRLQTQKDVYSWNFLFLGSDFDVGPISNGLGNRARSAINYTPDTLDRTYSNLSKGLSQYRTSNQSVMSGAVLDVINQ